MTQNAYGTTILVPIRKILCFLWASFTLTWLCAETAFAADPPGPPSQNAIIQEVVRVANAYIEHGPCEASRADPSVVATMSPYTSDVAAGRAAAKYAVLWAGDINCSRGSGTNTMNILLVEKRGADPPRIVGVNDVEDAASFERIVAATSDSLTVDVYTWADDDPHCCASKYERWTLRREPDSRPGMPKGHYMWNVVDSKPAPPVPLKPGEKKLPTAKLKQ